MAFKKGGKSGKSAWLKVGEILLSNKREGELYIKMKEDVTLKVGQTLQIKDPRKSLEEAVNAGRLTEEKAETILSKIPDFVCYELILPPAKD